jgi:hypothetical protein
VADQQVRFDEQLVVDPVEAPGGEPPGRQDATDAAVGDGGDEATLAEEQQGRQQDTGDGDGARGDFQAVLGFATGMAGAFRQYAVPAAG